jgi:SAM-dependent methyltransferase
MPDAHVTEQMRADWNNRAREDAAYYVAFGGRGQSAEEFFSTATETVQGLELELRRFPGQGAGRLRALEIGCGPGRLMAPLSRRFRQVHGVDVSDEMVRLARRNLRGFPNAHVHFGDGASLTAFADESFDFVYSYAVFQHIPSREVIFQYLREAYRVLKTGGLIRAQFNGLPQQEGAYNTWSGVRLAASDLMEFARERDLQVLALEGVQTQYMWTTWRKQPQGWRARLFENPPGAETVIRKITNANSSEPVAPASGRYASISLWVHGLPEDCGLPELQSAVGAYYGTVTYIGPRDNSGIQQVNVLLPNLEETGLLPVSLHWMGQRIAGPAYLRVIPPGPQVPRVLSVTDGVNLCGGTRITSRSVKVVIDDLNRPHELAAFLDGRPVEDLELFCTDPRPQRFEVNFRLPENVTDGTHILELVLERRRFAPVTLTVG